MFIYGTAEEDYDEDGEEEEEEGENGKRCNEQARAMNCGSMRRAQASGRSLPTLASLPTEPSGTT